MPFEKGGRADKQGNRYEINCIIYEMLKVSDETNYGVIIEALGTDEIGKMGAGAVYLSTVKFL